MKIAVREAKNRLSKYGRLAHDGERVVVTKNGHPWFDLVPHHAVVRKTTPLPGVSSVISLEEAMAPVRAEDLPGWM